MALHSTTPTSAESQSRQNYAALRRKRLAEAGAPLGSEACNQIVEQGLKTGIAWKCKCSAPSARSQAGGLRYTKANATLACPTTLLGYNSMPETQSMKVPIRRFFQVLCMAAICATADAAVLPGASLNFSFTTGVPLANQVVATFTDSNSSLTPANFTATINWGDGSTTIGTIIGPSPFSVSGNHTYAGAGPFAVSVNISDGGSTATATATAATVSSVPVLSLPALTGLALLLAICGAYFSRKKAFV